MQTEYQERLEKAHLEYFLSSDVQSNVSGSQLALDLFGRRPLRHVDFNEHLLHGLVPGAPGGPAGDHPAPLFEVRRHEAAAAASTAPPAPGNPGWVSSEAGTDVSPSLLHCEHLNLD